MSDEIFDGGPPTRLEAWTRLRQPGDPRVLRLAISLAVIAWLPPALLAAISGDLIRAPGAGSYLQDIAMYARNVIALPLLILGEAICIPRLGATARQFVQSNLIRDSDRGRFEAALASTRRLRNSWVAELVVLLIAYASVLTLAFSVAAQHFPAWQFAGGEGLQHYSPAGWWNFLVSLPLLLMLLMGWIWRLILWTRLLWLISRLDLHLLASHPDRTGGLLFAAYSVRSWVLPALAPSVIAAGSMANRVVHEGVSPLTFKFLMAGIAATTVVLFAAPLMVFNQRLLAAWDQGVRAYGALTDRVGHEFERQWVHRTDKFPEDPLQTGAFSATTDLYQVVSNVYQMRLMLVDPKSVLALGVIAMLPFVPILLISMPLGVLLRKLLVA